MEKTESDHEAILEAAYLFLMGLQSKAMHGITAPTMRRGRQQYKAPPYSIEVYLSEVLKVGHRSALESRQLNFLRSNGKAADIMIYAAGDKDLLAKPCVSVVGTRDVSDSGYSRARRLARELVEAGIVVVSGLARGVDEAAHLSAIENGGSTIAVIGTPLDKAYPAEHSKLQEEIYAHHLLLSPFRIGESTFKSNFPKRNRVMASISDATVIVEASDSSGTLHQAAECQRLRRWLFIAKSVADDQNLNWPKRFIGKEKVKILSETTDILATIGCQ